MYTHPDWITLPSVLGTVSPVPVPAGTLAPPVPTDPVTPLKATAASDFTQPPPYRVPQLIVPPSAYPTLTPPILPQPQPLSLPRSFK